MRKEEIIRKFIEVCNRNGKPLGTSFAVDRAVEELREALEELEEEL